jgi:hypothetical protein
VCFSEDYRVKYEAERLPPPLVTDLNGDGKAEILVATHDAEIQVVFQLTFILIFSLYLATHIFGIFEGLFGSSFLCITSNYCFMGRVSVSNRTYHLTRLVSRWF